MVKRKPQYQSGKLKLVNDLCKSFIFLTPSPFTDMDPHILGVLTGALTNLSLQKFKFAPHILLIGGAGGVFGSMISTELFSTSTPLVVIACSAMGVVGLYNFLLL